MSIVPLVPTHVVLTRSEITSAWNGQPVSKIAEEDGVATIVFLFEADYAATTFTAGLRHSMPPEWGVSPENVAQVYSNGNHDEPIPWLDDNALVTKMLNSDLKPLIRADRAFTPNMPEKSRNEAVADFCDCLSLTYEGVEYLYATEHCSIHGEHRLNKNDLVYGLTHGELSTVAAASIEYTERIEPYSEIDQYTLYGWGVWIDDNTEGLFVSTPDNKFGHYFYFIPKYVFAREHWYEVVENLQNIIID